MNVVQVRSAANCAFYGLPLIAVLLLYFIVVP